MYHKRWQRGCIVEYTRWQLKRTCLQATTERENIGNDKCTAKRTITAPYSLPTSAMSDLHLIFTALHAMQTRCSDENSVRLSVRPSVCLSVRHTRALWQNGRKIFFRFIYRTKEHLSQFSEKKNGWWGEAPSTWNFGSTDPRWNEIADFQPIIARSSSAVTPSEKKFN